ncbi:F-box/LRR-repeat protein 3-like [Vicia villosa]|uniref:F-box/LRR-repeat protein 3-like n=1 Tax=Vicia villosa TaxID=3911 RepID=UPI00273A849B|nr:F-box/LRR-repeat protein 3-like [Vicia villosa]
MTKTKRLSIRKKKRTCVKSLQHQQQQSFSSTNSIVIVEPDFEFYLPDECWEHVFTFLINPVKPVKQLAIIKPANPFHVFPFPTDPVYGTIKDKYKRNFESLSLVSKHFLALTNRLIFSLKIYYPQLFYLPRFFHRFSNLNSLDLWFASHYLDAGLALTLRDRSSLRSLSISMFELNDAKYVTSHYIDSLLSLKCLNSLKFCCSQISDDLLYSIARQGLPLKTFVLENCTGYSFHGIYDLLSKCRGIRYLGLQGVDFLNNHHVFQLFSLVPDLVSINLSKCSKLTESALFALIKNCHSLGEITMESIYMDESPMENIYIESKSVENYDILKNFDVNPQLKFLYLFQSSFINDGTIILFASFPNLQHLDLSFCHSLSEKGICQVLNSCCKLRHLKLIYCKVRGLKLNFVVHQLEVLDLSYTGVDDKTLYEISKSCCGLLKLLLMCCEYVTKKGVKRVVENCKQCLVIK